MNADFVRGHGDGARILIGATGSGIFMHAPDPADIGGIDYGMPKELQDVLRYVIDNDCDYVLFDSDGPFVEELPAFYPTVVLA
jgi:hypothetical protein